MGCIFNGVLEEKREKDRYETWYVYICMYSIYVYGCMRVFYDIVCMYVCFNMWYNAFISIYMLIIYYIYNYILYIPLYRCITLYTQHTVV